MLRSIDLENKISPVDCRDDLKQQRRIIEDNISGLNQEIGKLGKTKDELEAFLQTYPGEEPRPVYEDLVENKSKLKKEVELADKAP